MYSFFLSFFFRYTLLTTIQLLLFSFLPVCHLSVCTIHDASCLMLVFFSRDSISYRISWTASEREWAGEIAYVGENFTRSSLIGINLLGSAFTWPTFCILKCRLACAVAETRETRENAHTCSLILSLMLRALVLTCSSISSPDCAQVMANDAWKHLQVTQLTVTEAHKQYDSTYSLNEKKQLELNALYRRRRPPLFLLL